MIGADAIVKCLEAEGVEYVFGYPGVAICPFYNSILHICTDVSIYGQGVSCFHFQCRGSPEPIDGI